MMRRRRYLLLLISVLTMIIPVGVQAEEAREQTQTNFADVDPNASWPSPVSDEESYSFFLAEILEQRVEDDEARWDVFGWYGGDYNRLWVKSEGNASTDQSAGEGDIQVLYGRLISRYFDLQTGLRYEQAWSEGADHARGLFALGVQGLAPYYFDVEPTFFLSQDGEASLRFTGTYDILFTQRLVLQPRLEGNWASANDRDFGIGAGINNIEAGLRLRYEIWREFAPYIGVNYGKRYDATARFAREEGVDAESWSFVTGVRLWF